MANTIADIAAMVRFERGGSPNGSRTPAVESTLTRVMFIDENQKTTMVELPWNADRTGPDEKALAAKCTSMGVEQLGDVIILPKDVKIDYILFLEEKETSLQSSPSTTMIYQLKIEKSERCSSPPPPPPSPSPAAPAVATLGLITQEQQ